MLAFKWVESLLENRRLFMAVAVLVTLVAVFGGRVLANDNDCGDPADSWVFCHDFEEGDLDAWDDYDGNPPETNTLMEHPGPLNRAGNHVVRLRAPAGCGGADLVKVLPDTFDRLYARWMVMWEPGYDFDARVHGGGLHAGARGLLGGASGHRPDGTNRFSATIEPRYDNHRLNFYSYYRGMYQDCADPDGSCWGDSFPCMDDEGEVFCTKPQHRPTVMPPVMQTGQWYCIEMLLDGGTATNEPDSADGVLNLWIDGVEIGPWDDLWMRTTENLKITILWINLWHHGEHSVEGIMVDDVVVSTEYIGCPSELTGVSDPGEPTWGSFKATFR